MSINLNSDIKFVQSPNYNASPTITPTLIVIHWTAGSYTSAVNWFQMKQAQASAHFVVSKDGSQITQMVALNNRAWHAGSKSYHPMGGVNVNNYSIGIELEGPPSYIKSPMTSTGWSRQQMVVLWDLCKLIKSKVPTIVGITDHSTILPTQKTDVLGGKGIDKFTDWVPGVDYTGLIDMATENIRHQVRDYFKM